MTHINFNRFRLWKAKMYFFISAGNALYVFELPSRQCEIIWNVYT